MATKMGYVDALSRLPINEGTNVDVDRINFMNFENELPLEVKDIQEKTRSDPIISQVYEYVLNGWPSKVNKDFMPYYLKRKSLSTEDECLYYINRVVVPEVLRETVLNRLHECHTGIVRMKMMARSYVWWPLCDQDIENHVDKCLSCQQSQPVSRKPTTTSWPTTTFPFQRIHIDFFDFSAKRILLISDAYSKFCDVYIMSSTNAESVIEKLTNLFCMFGLPTELVSDNGPPFPSKKFKDFLQSHKIKYTPAPPYHPQSNGQAERAVRTIKDVFFKFITGVEQNLTLKEKIQKFIIYHNNSPSTTTGKSPSSIIFSFKPKTLLDLINCKTKQNIDKDLQINELDNNVKKSAKFEVGQNVMYLNHYKSHLKWIPAKVVQLISLHTYLINVYGNIRYVHENQLKISKLSDVHHNSKQSIMLNIPKRSILKSNVSSPKDDNSDDESRKKVTFNKSEIKKRSISLSETELNLKSRPTRTVKKPDRYIDIYN